MKKIAEILDELKDIGVDWDSHPNDAYLFDVPKGYFDTLPEQLVAHVKASESDTELNIGLDKVAMFEVPENYFETLSNNILSKIRASEEIINGKVPLFDEIPAVNPYQVPENYFASLSENIISNIASDNITSEEEIEDISPLLATLRDKTSYEAPDTYFNAFDFSEKIQVETIESKVIEHPSVKSIKWARWAAAASIVLIFSIGGAKFLGTNKAVNENQKLEQSLAKIPDAKIQEWLSNNLDESDMSNFRSSYVNTNKIKTAEEQRIEDIENDFY